MPVISDTSPSWNRIPIVGKSHFVRNIAVCLVYNFFWCHIIFLYAWCARMESNHHPRFRRPVYYPLYYGHIKLAEVVGFEPTDPFEPSVFKTAALSHAQPYFHILAPRVRIERTTSSLTAKRNYLCAIGELIGCRGWIRTTDLQLMRLAGTAVLPYSAIFLVEVTRIELATSCLQSRRSPK